MNGQGRQHDGGNGIAGDAESQRGDKRPARDGVVGRFRGDDAVGLALADIPAPGRGTAGLAVAQEGGGRGARSGEDAHERADEGRLHQPGHPASPFAKGRKLNPAGGAVFHAGLAPHPFDAIQNLGEREHADNDRDKVDTAVQGENIERETRFGGKRRHAHTGEQQPEHAHGQPLELVVGRYAGNAGQPHQDQGARFKRPELQGENGDLRRGESKDHAREHASENRCRQCPADGLSGLSRPRHRIAVKSRGRGLGRSGRIDEHGGNGAATDGAAVDPEQQGDGRYARHTEGEGQADRDGDHGPQTGQRAHDHAEHHAHEIHCEGKRRKSRQQGIDEKHVFSFSLPTRIRKADGPPPSETRPFPLKQYAHRKREFEDIPA